MSHYQAKKAYASLLQMRRFARAIAAQHKSMILLKISTKMWTHRSGQYQARAPGPDPRAVQTS